jgi:molybdate transport system ATP-binding protein
LTSKILLQVENAQVHYLGEATFHQLNFTWEEGQHWAIIGDSGRELTAFLETLRGTTHLSEGCLMRPFADAYCSEKTAEGTVHSFRDLIAYVSQQYRFRNKSNLQNFYFQQRFNSAESDQAATVRDYLTENSQTIPGPWTLEKVSALLRLDLLLDTSILKLSNGETRRLALALGLLRQPKIYLMDHPMTGLDLVSRTAFGDFLQAIIQEGIHVAMSTSSFEIPAGITRIAKLDQTGIAQIWLVSEYNLTKRQDLEIPWDPDLFGRLLPKVENGAEVIRLENVSIRYGNKSILDQLNWTVNSAERWQIKGKNGSGKSTLISLLIGENPQAYSQNIYLFGRKRGSGESIWDVKRPTGFVAPELTRYFPANQTCVKVILSGFFDTMGLFKKVTPDQESKAMEWLTLFDLLAVKDIPISKLSLAQQRWTLLARALIKEPKLLILDEASQGLDDSQREIFKETIEKICDLTSITLLYVSHYPEDIPDQVNKIFDLDSY